MIFDHVKVMNVVEKHKRIFEKIISNVVEKHK
jgi:hypothetical protein